MNRDEVMRIIKNTKNLLINKIIKIEDIYSGKCYQGTIKEIINWIKNINEQYNNKCIFKLDIKR